MQDRKAYAYPPKVMRRTEAARYVGLSLSAFDTHSGKPKAIMLGPQTPGWLRDDLDAWVDRIAGRATQSTEQDFMDAIGRGEY